MQTKQQTLIRKSNKEKTADNRRFLPQERSILIGEKTAAFC